MNYCNFAKVILARCSRDKGAIEWWQKKDDKGYQTSIDTTMSVKLRHENYMMFMDKFPKMHIDLSVFKKSIGRIQNYLTSSKYWANSNKSSERTTFIANFSLMKWASIPENDKAKHQL